MASTTLRAEPLGACPHCGEPLAFLSTASTTDKPLQECASCGRICVRSGVKEWGLLPASQKLACVARHVLVVLVLGVALPLGHWIVVLSRGERWQLEDSLRWLVLGVALAAAMQVARLTTRIRESRRRMRDPMYLAKLAQVEIAEASRR